MRKQSNKFQGKQLRQARLIRNLTIQDLAKKINVSHQAVSKYESDQMEPSFDVLNKLSEVLGFHLSFFFKEPLKEEFYNSSFIFRKKSGVAKKYQKQLVEHMSLIYQFVSFLNEQIHLPKFNQELILCKSGKFQMTEEENIEQLATEIRRYLNLGDGPIDNMTLLCEKLGVVIVYVDLSKSLIDGCSSVFEGRPVVLLNDKKDSSVRRRFTIAHELGHILLHSKLNPTELLNSSNSKRIEYEANLFASFLLMPESTFSRDINGIGLDYLLILKEHWKVSLQAMIFRAEYLGLFTQDYALYLRQQISRKKWRSKEPLDDKIPYEEPVLLNKAIQFLIKKKELSLSEISFKTGIKEENLPYHFAEELNHHENYNGSDKPYLRRIK